MTVAVAALPTDGMWPPLSPLRRRRATASEFLAVPWTPDCRLISDVASSSTAFLGGEAGDGDEKPPTCYNRKGKVCNRSKIGVDPLLKFKLERQQRNLIMAQNGGFCSDPAILTQEECDGAGGEWTFMDGPSLDERIATANALAAENRAHIERAARHYQRAFERFDQAYKAYRKELVVWQQAISGVEDDYNLFCRPFHDTSMSCELKFRRAMHGWFAREPLPSCEVGAVTPYMRKAMPKGFFASLFG
eukprot:TRINITY_DN69631_c0_g1_i1.p1 TRINITY_DN69631_c0_g1~~TRINITY_DN69631_c0_g1_i1.p1  ORF type:complete len:260 (-),score=45.01 TRINITY_DN69631_c0_g1_i1:40-780(-)